MELKIEQVLKSKGVDYRLLKLSQNAFTVDDIVKYSEGDVDVSGICKTIILKGKKTGKTIAVMLKGTDKVGFSKVKKLTGEEMGVATPDQVKEVANVEPGAVCPFLLNVDLLVDTEVMNLQKINCGSGDHLFGLEFKTEDLIKCVEYKVADVAKSPVQL